MKISCLSEYTLRLLAIIRISSYSGNPNHNREVFLFINL